MEMYKKKLHCIIDKEENKMCTEKEEKKYKKWKKMKRMFKR